MTDPKPYDTSRYGKLYQDAQRQETLLAPLTEDQRAEVRRLHQSTPWSLEQCVRRVTHPAQRASFPEITPEGLDRLYAAMKDQEETPAPVRRRPAWPARALQWLYGHLCNTYARVLLRDPSLTLSELKDIHGLADEELPPHLAAQAQKIIAAEISRRARKDY